FGDRKRLLLHRDHVELQEVVGERSIALGVAFELTQRNLSLARVVRGLDRLVESLLRAVLLHGGNLKIALVGFSDTLEFVADRPADLPHLIAEVLDREMLRSVAV